jgi:hypothetical protein
LGPGYPFSPDEDTSGQPGYAWRMRVEPKPMSRCAQQADTEGVRHRRLLDRASKIGGLSRPNGV